MSKKTGKNGELTGVMKRPKWDNPQPYGMLEIPAGSFHMGQNDQDVNQSQIAHNRQITMSAFWMDDAEISNNEYRQFVDAYYAQGKNSSMVKENKDGVRFETADYGEPNAGGGGGQQLKAFDSTRKFLNVYYGFVDTNKEITEEELNKLIYPDTLVWQRDFSYAYNEPLMENYYWHCAFDKYPVVGVNWWAAQAFCHWRTLHYNKYRRKKKKPILPRFRLPTEAEWEYAARGGYEHKLYPWEGPYLRNSKGCALANWKPGRGDYIIDNYEYTAPTYAYWPNDYGLYNMVGNVAEWCEDDFQESATSYNHDLNPVFYYRYNPRVRGEKPPQNSNYPYPSRRKVIRGGSWKDIGYFLSVGTRTYEFADTCKSFIGFRSVVSILGRSGPAQR
jgi:gliding motility-associated lipoprotein GldK